MSGRVVASPLFVDWKISKFYWFEGVWARGTRFQQRFTRYISICFALPSQDVCLYDICNMDAAQMPNWHLQGVVWPWTCLPFISSVAIRAPGNGAMLIYYNGKTSSFVIKQHVGGRLNSFGIVCYQININMMFLPISMKTCHFLAQSCWCVCFLSYVICMLFTEGGYCNVTCWYFRGCVQVKTLKTPRRSGEI